MGFLQTFEIELNEESKERKKLVGLRVESELPNDESSEYSELVALLSNNFEKVLKRLNTRVKGNSHTCKCAPGAFNLTKPVRTQGTPGLNSINKPIRCRECKGYGHIQVECVNTKKN